MPDKTLLPREILGTRLGEVMLQSALEEPLPVACFEVLLSMQSILFAYAGFVVDNLKCPSVFS